jgi:signal transduction histidine kinase
VRPLDFLRSLKLKLGVVIVAAVALTAGVIRLSDRIGLDAWLASLVAVALALALVQVLAHGMTLPLREMVAAARAMARGQYGLRVTASSRDEVGELARAFNAMATELAEVDRMRRDLVANASHELRTPIGALRAMLENDVDGVEPLDARAALVQVERLGALVEQLLDLSRLESGAVPLERSEVAVARLLAEVADEWRPRASERRVRLDVDVAPPGLSARVDPGRMRQVVENLASNAIRHAPDGGAVVLRARPLDGRLRLEVEDDGPGIAPEEAERVFERFYRADAARASADGGVGLGLAIARWIVDLHDGSIRAEATGDPGCRMVVELPR